MNVADILAGAGDVAESMNVDWEPGSDVMIIAFSGLSNRVRPWQAFNFMGTVQAYPVHKLFLRDPTDSWFHKGLVGLTSSIDESCELIAEIIGELGVTKTVAIGGSAGGYGALVHGWLLECDEVHAMVPQTHLSIDGSAPSEFVFWEDMITAVHAAPESQPEYFDFLPLIQSTPDIKTKFHLYHSTSHQTDSDHATRLEGQPNVTLHSYPTGGHRLTARLLQSGILNRALEDSLGVEPDLSRLSEAARERFLRARERNTAAE